MTGANRLVLFVQRGRCVVDRKNAKARKEGLTGKAQRISRTQALSALRFVVGTVILSWRRLKSRGWSRTRMVLL
jgi:hypothetical protein